jgi:hypothetical protein
VKEDDVTDRSTTGTQRRMDTSLETEGAEFLVLGNLLVEGIQAFKTYTNFPGYDIIATNVEKNTNCRIQVKSRWATDFDGGFPIRNFDCDFVVLAALNRGYRYRSKSKDGDDGRRLPQFYVYPVGVVRESDRSGKWGKAYLNRIGSPDLYLDNWDPIREFLGLPKRGQTLDP